MEESGAVKQSSRDRGTEFQTGGRGGPFEWWSIVGRKEGDRGREKERERGIAAKSVADWRPKARLQIPGVMPVIRGFGAQ